MRSLAWMGGAAGALAALTASANAADLQTMLQEDQRFSRLIEVVNKAGLGEQLGGDETFTVFAPTNDAFAALPEGAMDRLMQADSAQLQDLLGHHVVVGEEVTGADLDGRQTTLSTMDGATLTIDATTDQVMVVPAGLSVQQVGDELVIRRRPDVETTPESGAALQQAAAASQQEPPPDAADGETDVTEQGMPATEHQQGVLQDEAAAASGETAVTGSGMPASEHQTEVLQGDVQTEQQQTASASALPTTVHQEQALARDDIGGHGALREAIVVEPDLEADNGVVHAIDAVLVPADLLPVIEGTVKN